MKSLPILLSVFAVVISSTGLCSRHARAETMVIERVVPPGATLTYSVGGQAVHAVNVPEGRVRVTVEYGGAITPRHRHRRAQ